MHQHAPVSRIVRFGSYEVDLLERRLTKAGLLIRLQGQPFQILALLLDHAGQTVTREEIRRALWSDQIFVEFDDALNTAIRKLRAALGDTADNPRFLETVPRRGYRFIAPVTCFPEPEPAVSPATPAPGLVVSALAVSRLAESGFAESGSPLPESAHERESDSPRPPFAKLGRRLAAPAGAALLILLVSALYWQHRRHIFRITDRDTIVIADFVNTTGQSVFDDALRQGLEIGLQQSPYINVLPDRRASLILRQMGRSPEERMTGRSAIELCQRAGGKVAVQGSISSLGKAYLLGLAAIRCDTGYPVAYEQVQAGREDSVLGALGRATSQLRSRLGESLPSVRKYNAPLEQATTTSLDALNAYGLALTTWDRKGDRDSLPIFRRATELDPNFAQAYGALATIYHNLGDADLARRNAARAWELRAQVTQAEKANIEARYYSYVTGELENAREVRALEVQNYPDSAGAFNHLGNVDADLGRYEDAVQDFRRALLLDQTRANTYASLAAVLLALNQTDGASAVLAQAAQRKLQTDTLLQTSYWLAFLRDDRTAMQDLLQANEPGAQPLLLSEQSNTEAYYGRFATARELSRKAASLMEQEGDRESAAGCLAQAALREAEIGESAPAQDLISQARKLSQGLDVIALSALGMARLGNLREAEALSLQLSREWPSSTYVRKYWLPVIHAEMDLHRGAPSQAVDDLKAAAPPLEFASPLATPFATLYPAYVRGRAYLANGDGTDAAREFQKFSDHRGVAVNNLLVPLARVGLARARARNRDISQARKEYESFFGTWNHADRDLPPMKQAKMEYMKLQ